MRTSFSLPVDCRSRLKPALPSTYFGNCILIQKACAEAEDLHGEDGIVSAVEAISEALRELDESDDVLVGFEGVEIRLVLEKDKMEAFIAEFTKGHLDLENETIRGDFTRRTAMVAGAQQKPQQLKLLQQVPTSSAEEEALKRNTDCLYLGFVLRLLTTSSLGLPEGSGGRAVRDCKGEFMFGFSIKKPDVTYASSAEAQTLKAALKLLQQIKDGMFDYEMEKEMDKRKLEKIKEAFREDKIKITMDAKYIVYFIHDLHKNKLY
ncbi:hypothetical protein FNV43_RR04055 [Rhamnella rubrinervis]|uniref:Uncharacterized protein n=1 Tax=Rhamnella rubrinervis TaxID=2594499 RepID=A0A8K0HL40_9ROSA|nr:hypothetical protein FNV43_RR04055 [Rhamnella rubrinervis]